MRRLDRVGAGARKVVGGGVRVITNVVTKGIAAAAPVGPTRKVKGRQISGGGLGYSIGGRQKKSGGEIVQAKSGIGVGKTQTAYGEQVTKGKKSVPWGHLVAGGTTDRYTGQTARINKKTGRVKVKSTGKLVRYTGRVRPVDFVARGYKAVKSQAEAAGIAEMEKQLTKLGG